LNLSLDPSTFIGIEANDLKLVGSGKIYKDDASFEEFTLEGPISSFRVIFSLLSEEKGLG
jgi:hypothetical protein